MEFPQLNRDGLGTCASETVPLRNKKDERKYERYRMEQDVLVALRLPSLNADWTFTGHMVDISLTGISFTYFPKFADILNNSPCEVRFKKRNNPFTGPLAGETVYETGADVKTEIIFENAFFTEIHCLPEMKRCGLRFNQELSFADLESFLSC
jgi:hypothetical protein